MEEQVPDWPGIMVALNQECEALAEKYIGKKELDRGRSITDEFLKKQWYCNRIHQVGVNEGSIRVRQGRCKYGSERHKYFDGLIEELYKLKEHLMLELIAL